MQNLHPYGSAGWRFLAFIIDSLIIAAFGAALDLYLGLSVGVSPGMVVQQVGLPSIIKLGVHLLYWPLFESSLWQATPGKRLCRLYVADVEGRRITFVRAFVRNLAKFLSLLPLGFGFLMIAVTVRNQCLHDKIVGTVVLKRQKPQPLSPPG